MQLKRRRHTARLASNIEARTKMERFHKDTVQLLTGHGAFIAYLVKIGKLPAEAATCKCGNDEDNAEHVLFDYRRQN